jgi:hypothetical protein
MDEPIKFTYKIKIVDGRDTLWSDRMDHYSLISTHYEKVYHEQIIYAFSIIAVLTFFAFVVISSMLKNDFETINKIEEAQNKFINKLRKRKHSALELSHDEIPLNEIEEA